MRVATYLCLVLLFYFSRGQSLITLTAEDNPVIEEDNFTFSCNYTGTTGFLTFQVNGVASGPLHDRVISEVSGNTIYNTYIFPNVTRADDGTVFTCTAGAETPVSVTLIVHYPGLYDQPSPNVREQFVNTQFTVDLTLEEGFPATEYSWEFNGNPLDNSDRIILSQTSLKITSLMLSDNGTYTVTANNTAGNTTATFSVIVFVGPILTQSNGSIVPVTITAGDSFTVDCTASESVPEVMNYTVIVNDIPMTLTNPMRTFDNLMPSDSGVYRCQADSGKAISYFDYSLTVQEIAPTSSTTNTMQSTVTPSNTPDSGASYIVATKLISIGIVLANVCYFLV